MRAVRCVSHRVVDNIDVAGRHLVNVVGYTRNSPAKSGGVIVIVRSVILSVIRSVCKQDNSRTR